ncbi:MAG: AAA family ATPase [Verrucomicrobia bacterium]|nr:AAA family ATPase [Verrucomicrobiota bacterium]
MSDEKEPVKIHALEVENVKRVRAVSLDCSGRSLTVIGGRNGQGKTSLLDAIIWTLGGDRYRPSRPLRDGAAKLASRVELSNGIVVERSGEKGSLKVTDTTGKRHGGQALLNEFVSQFALNLPAFMAASAKEKANMLLECFPEAGTKLQEFNEEIKRIYDDRHLLGQAVTRKKKYAEELPFIADMPVDLLTGTEMTQRLQDALRVNAENDRLRREVESLRIGRDAKAAQVKELQRALEEATAALNDIEGKLARAEAAAAGAKDEDTSALKRELEQIDATNAKIRKNMDKAKAEAEAAELNEEYNALTRELEEVRAQRLALLAELKMPLEQLAIDEEGELTFRNARWDGMSGAEQLRVAVAICAAVKPQCGFVLLDGLERMDVGQLREFATWLQSRDLQAIGTRVGEDGGCSIVIEDGQATNVTPVADEGAEATGDFKF